MRTDIYGIAKTIAHFMGKFESAQEIWVWRGATFAATLLAVIVSIIGIVMSALAFANYSNFNSPLQLYSSAVMAPNPYAIYINSAGAPIIITLPADLTQMIGNIYRIVSKTAQAHSVVITSGMGATWDGVHTVATFAAQIGAGMEFEVVSKTLVRVWSSPSVSFS
jgi:hypothetical protein